MTEEQHRQIVIFAAANGKDASMMTLEDALSAARTPTARRVFTMLHQDKAEKIRKLRPTAAIKYGRSGRQRMTILKEKKITDFYGFGSLFEVKKV